MGDVGVRMVLYRWNVEDGVSIGSGGGVRIASYRWHIEDGVSMGGVGRGWCHIGGT